MTNIVVSLGGSIVAPKQGINVKFLVGFKKLLARLSRRMRFYIVVGGGAVTRQYQKAAREVKANDIRDLDWIGIAATRLNVELVRVCLGEMVCPIIINNPNQLPKSSKKIFIGCGWKPGWSTDYDAVLIAKNIGAKTVINLSNIDYVYDKDPKKYSEAKPIKKMHWRDLRGLVGSQWRPGFNLPFDPKACALAALEKMSVVFLNGNNLKNFEKYLCGKGFVGTVVR